jgi:hypothetical protein
MSAPAPDSTTHTTAPRRAKRARDPTPGAPPPSRAACERLRKAEHSRIEKTRRTKINAALAELRELVPRDTEVSPARAAREADENGDAAKETDGPPAPRDEREFKLDVLVRTVAYMKTLVDRVGALEVQVRAPPPDNRARTADDWPEAPPAKRACVEGAPARSAPPTPSVQLSMPLPSISAWLPLLPYADPSALAAPRVAAHTTPRHATAPSATQAGVRHCPVHSPPHAHVRTGRCAVHTHSAHRHVHGPPTHAPRHGGRCSVHSAAHAVAVVSEAAPMLARPLSEGSGPHQDRSGAR